MQHVAVIMISNMLPNLPAAAVAAAAVTAAAVSAIHVTRCGCLSL